MKFNILYVVLELFAGGLENGIVNLINHSSDRFNHVICCLRKKGVFEKRFKKNVRVIELNMKHGNDYSIPYKILKVIKRNDIHLIRAFNEEAFCYSFLPAKASHKPIIYYNGGRTFPEKTRRLLVERLFGNFADCVVVPSNELKKYMNNTVGIRKSRISVIYNGVDIDRFNHSINKEVKKSELGIPKNNTVIGTVGRLADQKDIFTFLKISRKLLQTNKNITFLIVGDGPLRSELQTFSQRLCIEDDVKFLGVRDDVADLYHVMDIFLLTSKWEGMSNVCLEAMAAKKTVLATDVEGIRAIIDNAIHGYIFNIGDIDGFVQKINMLTDKTLYDIGNNAYHRIKVNFTLQKMVHEYENLYIKLAT